MTAKPLPAPERDREPIQPSREPGNHPEPEPGNRLDTPPAERLPDRKEGVVSNPDFTG